MEKSVKKVFEDECKDLVIDAKLVDRIRAYLHAFINKNEDHITFFGGHLLGVQTVRFFPTDQQRWFEEIIQADEILLEDKLLALPKINRDFFVSSNTMNLSCAWLTHAIYTSKLNDKLKHEGMVNVMLIMQIKFITSLLAQYFRYPADKGVAEATYSALSYKFSIKQYGTWLDVLVARAEDIVSKTSIHYNAITKMADDDDVVRLLNDAQGRIRDIVKNIYAVFMDVHKQGIRIVAVSAVIEHDGEAILKDKSRNLTTYTRYINTVICDRNSFIIEDLAVIIEKLIHTMPPKPFRESLVWMVNNYRKHGSEEVEQVLNETLLHSFDYLSNNRDVVRNTHDLPTLLTRMKGVYMSSRSVDPELFSIRNKAEKIVERATGNKNPSVIASVRTGILLYIVLRTYCKNYYST